MSLRFLATAAVAVFVTLTASAAISPAAEPEVGFDNSRFEITVLATDLQRPMEMVVDHEGNVLFLELGGKVNRFDPKTQTVETIGEIKVTTANENGLIGIALDPDFKTNRWIYLQYSPPDYPGQHISRFTLNAENKIDMASEKLLFKFEEQRKECCHHAGSMMFGPDGCLYIGTGDNTHPGGDSAGYAPIDEREGKAPWDAQKSAANSKSGAGKILRIKPTQEGGYEVPDGNLFPKDGSEGLPEIYVMGCRNPWRMTVDSETGYVYWGEVGPDAGGDGPRGPRGYDEINQAKKAGNFGWPYFIANNLPYNDYDFATGKVGEKFSLEKPVNNSPNNTGARVLPPPTPALLYYPYADSDVFPELNAPGGRTACAGPVYHFEEALESNQKFPKHFDDVLFIYEWSRHWIKAVHLDADGNVAKIEPFMPGHKFTRPIDMQFGPEGALYLIEYGETWGVNKDARLIRIDYISGNRKPVAKASVENNVGRHPLEVSFSSEGTLDKDTGDTLKYVWRSYRAGDTPDAKPTIKQLSEEKHPKLTFTEPGVYNVELLVTDSHGAVNSAAVPVIVGNARPEIKVLQPKDGAFFDPDKETRFEIYVRDAEDGTSSGDEADDLGIDFLDPDAPKRVTMNASMQVGGEEELGPPGMRLMKGSDCFNCHSVNQKRVGPPLLEIANKYRDKSDALEASVKRVREGSTGVWGKVPMIPHSQHTDAEIREMVSWVYSLQDNAGLRVIQGFNGRVPAATSDAERIGNLVLEATYVDRGAEGVPPLSGSAKVTLRNRQIDAENADKIEGTQTLSSGSAHGGKFLGAINHGNYAMFRGILLEDVGGIRVRVSSAGAGAKVEVRLDKPDGPLLTTFDVKNNGAWENWYDMTNSIKEVEGVDTKGLHDLYFVFVNPGQSGLMNLDSVYFEPAE